MKQLNSLFAKKAILVEAIFPSKELWLHQQIIVGNESYFQQILQINNLHSIGTLFKRDVISQCTVCTL